MTPRSDPAAAPSTVHNLIRRYRSKLDDAAAAAAAAAEDEVQITFSKNHCFRFHLSFE